MSDPITASEHLDASVLADIRALAISGEDVLAEVMDIFLADVPIQLRALTTALEARDGEATWRVAHRLKGTALGMGAWRMANICATVECAARGQALEGVAAGLAELVAEFESTRLALEREVGGWRLVVARIRASA
jgi:HPt (histidine-containing phosphotransfer) domain-containing protein